MITKNTDSTNKKTSWPSIALILFGGILNITAIVTDGNTSSLVAIGCTLTAVGIIQASKGSKK